MLIKGKIIDICAKIMDIQDNTRLSRFLICFANLDNRLTPAQSRYLQIMMKVNQLGSDKKFTRQLSELSGTIAETEAELNKWVVASYNEKNLDF